MRGSIRTPSLIISLIHQTLPDALESVGLDHERMGSAGASPCYLVEMGPAWDRLPPEEQEALRTRCEDAARAPVRIRRQGYPK